jgi:hypothetical protein
LGRRGLEYTEFEVWIKKQIKMIKTKIKEKRKREG